MEYTVTGGSGYLGHLLVKRLLEEGHTVKAVVRPTSSNAALADLKADKLSLVEYDGTVDSLVPAVEDADYVIHMAAMFTTKSDVESVSALMKSNVNFSVNLFQAVKNFNPTAGIASASTFSAYDANGDYAPQTVYAATKAAVETLAPAFGVKVAFLRLSDTYGPSDSRTKIPNLVRDGIRKNNRFDFMSPDNQKINLTHADDVIDALIQASKMISEYETPTVESFDLFYPENEVTLGEMADLFNSNRNATLSFPLFGKITELPPQRRILPGFSPKRTPQNHLAKTVMGEG
jgi:nucleoside-diphosphate-sugar epimerase